MNGGTPRSLRRVEEVPQIPAELLLAGSIRVLEPLAQLLEGGGIDVAQRIPLTQDLQRGRRTRWLVRMV